MAKHKKRKPRAWTDDEIEFLRRNYGPLSAKQIAGRLDRPEDSVYKKIRALGIKKYGGDNHSIVPARISCNDLLVRWHPGDRVRVTLPAIPGLKKTEESRWTKRVYTGRVLRVYERYILVQLPGWKECVNVGTLISGEAQVGTLDRERRAEYSE